MENLYSTGAIIFFFFRSFSIKQEILPRPPSSQGTRGRKLLLPLHFSLALCYAWWKTDRYCSIFSSRLVNSVKVDILNKGHISLTLSWKVVLCKLHLTFQSCLL